MNRKEVPEEEEIEQQLEEMEAEYDEEAKRLSKEIELNLAHEDLYLNSLYQE